MQSPRQLTGRAVALMFIGFFAVVSAVNLVMVRAAVSTFAGLETKNPYQAGLVYEREIAAAAQQNERNWNIEASLQHSTDGPMRISIVARDGSGAPLPGLDGEVRLVHPASSRRDIVLATTETGAGRYQTDVDDVKGIWILDLTFSREGTQLFRSTSRVTLN